MTTDRSARELAVILHADVVGSTGLVQRDETIAHGRIRDAFRRFSEIIAAYGGSVQELRGDALLATFGRASDAVSASLAFQTANTLHNETLDDDIRPEVRVGIAIGEVVIADGTLTGPDVVTAQRIEQLAEPGGVCIQGTAFETIPRRLGFGHESLGEQTLKGFDVSVQVYSIRPGPGGEIPPPESRSPAARRSRTGRRIVVALVFLLVVGLLVARYGPWNTEMEPADPARMSYALPDVPSLAVLPFEDLSTGTEQSYFSDGITEDIITDLSKVSGLFVIARNSSFVYKDKPVEIRQVAEDLGVRYVLEGSVRRAGDQVRITAQLVDALEGNHVWAERFDREIQDVFSVQSEVARQVAKALAVTLKANENERLFQKYTTNIDAYEVFLQARRTVDRPARDNILRGERLFKRVIELDPAFAGGYAGLSFNYSVQVRFQFTDSPSERLAQTFELAEKAIEIDGDYAWGYIALGGAHLANADPEAAVNAVRHALALEPNGYEANLFMGFYLQFAGEAARAIEHLERARRLSPVVTIRDLAFMRLARFMNGDYDEVIRITDERDRLFPGGAGSGTGRVVVAAAYAMLDRNEEAAAMVKDMLADYPDFNLADWRYGKLWRYEKDRARLYDAAAKAGFPRGPGGD